jgi:hypothetical protein
MQHKWIVAIKTKLSETFNKKKKQTRKQKVKIVRPKQVAALQNLHQANSLLRR